jgi:MFS family permease
MTRPARTTTTAPGPTAGAAPAPESPAPLRNPVFGLFLVCAGALVGPLDTAVNVAFPAMTAAFGLALRDIQWVVIAFVVAQSFVTLVSGRLGDLYGHRRIFAIGMAACVLAHTAAGFAPDYAWLVAMRVLQGVAVGLAVACGPALATLLFPAGDKRRVLAIYVTTFSLGLALGPLLGGALIQWLGWPGVFWFRVPLALAVLLLLPLLSDVRASPGEIVAVADVDAPARSRIPLPRAAAFRSPAFLHVQFNSIVINFACFAIMLLVPYALSRWPGESTAAAGVLLAFFPGGSLLGGLLAGRVHRRMSSPAMMRAGLLLAAAGLVLTALWLPAHSAPALGAALLVAGLGLGLFQVGYMDATTSLLPPEDRGVAGGLVTVTRLLGIVLGVTGISALHEALASIETTIATMGAGLMLFAAVTAVIRRR